MDVAGGSGRVNADIQFMADRQAIVNTVTAYSYLFDEARREEFFALFSEDMLFENTTPMIGTIISRGKESFGKLFGSVTAFGHCEDHRSFSMEFSFGKKARHGS